MKPSQWCHRRWAGIVLAATMPFAHASLVGDVLECIDGGELRLDARCGPIAEEALESVRMVESLADHMVNRKEHRKAMVLLQTALRKYPESGSLVNRMTVARSYADEMNAIEARDRVRRAAPNSEEIDAAMTRIRCTRMSGSTGLEACERALARSPDDPMLLAAKGDLLAADGRAQESIAAFSAALRMQPNDVIVRQKIALLSGKKDRPPAVNAAAAAQSSRKDPTSRPPSAAAGAAETRPTEGELEQRLAVLQRLLDNKALPEAEVQARRRALLDAYLSPMPSKPAVPGTPAVLASVPALNFGNYHALVIGINRYRYLPPLETTHNDAKAIAGILKDKYDYKVRLLLDPVREQIIEVLDDLRETLTENDNLLIYYAGHGWLDKEADQGFWLPADARAERRSQWISNDTVRDLAKALKVKHMLVIADSCFSGTLTRGITVASRLDGDYLKRISGKKARQAMSSGGLEPVLDSVDGKHSPFAKALVQILGENRSVIDGTTLFTDLRRPVSLSAEQTPEFSDIRRAGHDGGDFLFVRRRQ